MARTKVIHLGTDHRYRISRSRTFTGYPNMLETKTGRRWVAVTTIQDPTFVEQRPSRCETWEDFTESPPPPVSPDATRRAMIVEADNPLPLSYQPPLDFVEREAWGKSALAEIGKFARTKRASEMAQEDLKRMAWVACVAVFALTAMVLAFITVREIWLS